MTRIYELPFSQDVVISYVSMWWRGKNDVQKNQYKTYYIYTKLNIFTLYITQPKKVFTSYLFAIDPYIH